MSAHGSAEEDRPVFAWDAKFWNFLKAGALPWVGLLTLLLLAAWLIFRLRNRYCGRADLAADIHEMLTQFRELHREGDLSDEEYRSIKSRLVQELDHIARRTSCEQPPREFISPGNPAAASPPSEGRPENTS